MGEATRTNFHFLFGQDTMRLLIVCLLIAVAVAKPLAQVYPTGTTDFAKQNQEYAETTSTNRIQLSLDNLPNLSTDSVNSLSVSVIIPQGAVFGIGFSKKADTLNRQAVWRIERVANGAQIGICTMDEAGLATPSC